MRSLRRLDPDSVAAANVAASEDDAHNTCLADQFAVGGLVECRLKEAISEIIDLIAGISQPRDLDNGFVAEM
jgi:hypothetical protein